MKSRQDYGTAKNGEVFFNWFKRQLRSNPSVPMATKAPNAGPVSPATVAKALLKTLSPPIAIATTIWCLWLYSHIGSKVGVFGEENGLMPRNLLWS